MAFCSHGLFVCKLYDTQAFLRDVYFPKYKRIIIIFVVVPIIGLLLESASVNKQSKENNVIIDINQCIACSWP